MTNRRYIFVATVIFGFTAAMFLYQFAKKYPWAHLDMAPVMKPLDGEYLAKDAKGFGVRFFVELARAMAAKRIRI